MSEPVLPIWTARGVHFVALLLVFGTLLFRVAVAPRVLVELDAAAAAIATRREDRLLWMVLVVAFVSWGWWFGQEAAVIAGAARLTDWIGTLRPVLLETQFGRMMMIRGGLLLGVVLAFGIVRRSDRFVVAALLAAVAVALQVLISHGAAAGGRRGANIVAAEIVHVLAAGAWIGSLLPLLVLITSAKFPAAAVASRRFSPMGMACVLLIASSASVLAFLLVGGLAGLRYTEYGHIMLIKVGLFTALLALAAGNRFVFTSALSGRNAKLARSRLIGSVLIECLLGLFVVLAAAKLASLSPGMHGHHHR